METGKRGNWVRIHSVVLNPDQRAPNLPAETRRVPLEMWATGALLEESAAIGDPVSIRTTTGRIVAGRLETIHPCYAHTFGTFVPELQDIRQELRDLMVGGGRGDGRESEL